MALSAVRKKALPIYSSRRYRDCHDKPTLEFFLCNYAFTFVFELKSLEQVPTVTDDPCKKSIRSQSIAKAHSTSLTKPINENPLTNLFVSAFDATLPPILNLRSYMLFYVLKTILHLVKIKPTFSFAIRLEAVYVVPACACSPIVYCYFSLWCVKKFDSPSNKCWRWANRKKALKSLRRIPKAVKPNE